MPVPQTAAKISEVVETVSELPVPQVVKENLEDVKVPQERASKRTVAQNVDATLRHVKFAESCGEAGSSWSSASDTTSTAATAVATTVAKSVGEAWPPGIAKYSASTESELAKSHGEGGSPWCRANGTSAAAIAVVTHM